MLLYVNILTLTDIVGTIVILQSEVGGMAKSTSITSIKPTKQETNINNVNNNPSQNTRDIPSSVSAVRSLPNLDNQPRGELQSVQ